MKKQITLALFLLILLIPGFAQSQTGKESLFHEISAQLLVKDQKTASDSLGEWALSRGGYFTDKSMDRLTLRIPNASLDDLKDTLSGSSEEILDFSQNATDMRENILMTRSSLEAREELLKRNLEYLESSDLEGTLTLEQEIRRLMQEIDSLKGTLRKLENDSSYALVDLYISFKNQSIPDGRLSRFDWINEVDFYSFMESSSEGALRGSRGPGLPLPDGFALSGEKPWFQALSPEGVRLRLKTEKNYPEQTEEFWSRALFSYLEGLGYIALKSETGDLKLDDNSPFRIRRWGVPYGRQDYIYMTGLRLHKGQLEVLEIAGSSDFIKEYF